MMMLPFMIFASRELSIEFHRSREILKIRFLMGGTFAGMCKETEVLQGLLPLVLYRIALATFRRQFPCEKMQ